MLAGTGSLPMRLLPLVAAALVLLLGRAAAPLYWLLQSSTTVPELPAFAVSVAAADALPAGRRTENTRMGLCQVSMSTKPCRRCTVGCVPGGVHIGPSGLAMVHCLTTSNGATWAWKLAGFQAARAYKLSACQHHGSLPHELFQTLQCLLHAHCANALTLPCCTPKLLPLYHSAHPQHELPQVPREFSSAYASRKRSSREPMPVRWAYGRAPTALLWTNAPCSCRQQVIFP